MSVQLKPVSGLNRETCISLKVSRDQEAYIASNEASLDEADRCAAARPFAIYADGRMVGFTMFAFDEGYEDPGDRYWLWRFMIGQEFQGRGYGRLALKEIIAYFKEHGADHIRLSTKAGNRRAISLYQDFGFEETGEMNGEETVFLLSIASAERVS